MNPRSLLGAFCLAFVTLVQFENDAWACSCKNLGRPPCSAFQISDAVFLGRVTNISDRRSAAGGPIPYTVTLLVIEAYKGVNTTQVTLNQGRDTCDWEWFQAGKVYVVYGTKVRGMAGGLEASMCSRTRDASGAAEDLAFLRALHGDKREFSIRGWVNAGFEQRIPEQLIINASVTIDGKKHTTRVDREGRFSLAVPGPGVYWVLLEGPAGTAVYSSEVSRQKDPAYTGELPTDFTITVGEGGCGYIELRLEGLPAGMVPAR
jgi:hypothetical protein